MSCDLSAITLFVTFPTLMVSIIHIFLRFTLLGLLHAGCWSTLTGRVVWEGSAAEDTQGEGRTPLGAAGESSAGVPNQVSSGLSPVQQWWGWRERWRFFLHAVPLFIICFFSPMGLTQTPFWMLLFVEWLHPSMVIREIAAHWPLTSCAHALLLIFQYLKH